MRGKTIYIVTRYQSILGVYENFDDATQVARTFIEKGQLCDIQTQIIK